MGYQGMVKQNLYRNNVLIQYDRWTRRDFALGKGIAATAGTVVYFR